MNYERRNLLVEMHLSLVDQIARKIVRRLPPCWELADVAAAGKLGLLDAATKFRPRRGVPFAAYARQRIRGAILDSLRRRKWRDQVKPQPLEPEAHQSCYLDPVEERIAHRERSRILALAMRQLPDREQVLLAGYYHAGIPLHAAGERIGVRASRASQLHRQALERLRRELGARGINRAA